MALSADAPRTYVEGNITEFPVKAATKIYQGAAVGDDAAGASRGLVAGDPFKGFAEDQADNSTGAVGAIDVRVKTKGRIKLSISGLAITDEGKDVYASDDGTFTLTQGSNTRIGHVHRWVSSGIGIVEFGATKGVQTELTDGTGGTANTALQDGLTAAAITDNSGGVDPGDDIIAVVTTAAAITDNSGGVDPGDDTIAAVTNLDTLTDSTGGTADDTVSDVSTAVTGVDGTGSNAASKADVDTRLTAINNNFKELVDQVITQKTANTALLAAVAQLAAKVNTSTTALTAAKAAVAQLAAKHNVVVTDLTSQNNNDADLLAAVNTIIRRLGN